MPPASLNLSGLDNSCTLKSHCTIDSFNTGLVLYPLLSFSDSGAWVSVELALGGKEIRLLCLNGKDDLLNSEP